MLVPQVTIERLSFHLEGLQKSLYKDSDFHQLAKHKTMVKEYGLQLFTMSRFTEIGRKSKLYTKAAFDYSFAVRMLSHDLDRVGNARYHDLEHRLNQTIDAFKVFKDKHNAVIRECEGVPENIFLIDNG